MLVKIEFSSDPEALGKSIENRPYIGEDDYVEFEGKKCLKFWAFVENFDYDLSKIPDNPVEYLQPTYTPYILDISKEQAEAICDMLVYFASTVWGSAP